MDLLGRKYAAAIVAILALTASSRVEAGFVALTYAGTNVFPGANGTSTGSGNFSFADNPSSLSLAQLTTFGFSQSTTASQPGFPTATGTFTYGLADLLSFSAGFGPGGGLTSLSFTTKAVAASSPGSPFAPESFVVTSLATNGAATFNPANQQLQAGTIAAVPEPASWAMTGIGGLMGLAYARRRQRAATA